MKRKPKPQVFFWQLAQRYLTEVCELHKPQTYVSHKSILGLLTVRFGGHKISEITTRDIQQYITEISKRMAPKSVADYWSVLRCVLRYAENEGLCDEPRRPRLPRQHRTRQPCWSTDEMRTLINGTVGPMHILVMLLAETGCRINEALALQTKHIDVERKQLHIHQGWSAGVLTTPKTDASYRTLALSDELCYALSAFRVGQPDCFLFRDRSGRPWRSGLAGYQFRKVCARLGLQTKGFHAFRRGNITLCLRDLRLPLQVVAGRVGHESGEFTIDVYVQKMDGYDALDVPKIAEVLYANRAIHLGAMRPVQQIHPPDEIEGAAGSETSDTQQAVQAGQTYGIGTVSLPG